MSFGPPPGVPTGKLNAATPTAFTADILRQQLEDIGINCDEITDANLNSYIDNVTSQLPDGDAQVYAIQKSKSGQNTINTIRDAGDLIRSAQGNWTLDNDAQGYYQELSIMQVEERWEWLHSNRDNNAFQGVRVDPPASTGYYESADAIQQLFIDATVTAASSVAPGIDQAALEAMLTDVIEPLDDTNISDYNVRDSRIMFLVFDYDPATQISEGVGSVTVEWHLTIEDYLRKDKDGGNTHDTYLKVSSRSVLYYSPVSLCTDYDATVKHFALVKAPACSQY